MNLSDFEVILEHFEGLSSVPEGPPLEPDPELDDELPLEPDPELEAELAKAKQVTCAKTETLKGARGCWHRF